MKRPTVPVPEKDLETQLREAYLADDPEAAWYFDRLELRVVRVSHGVTNVPELLAEEVEGQEHRYAEIPALTESELHEWMEAFVAEHADPGVASLLDERHGANERFVARLAEADKAAFQAWKEYHRRCTSAALATWRAGLA